MFFKHEKEIFIISYNLVRKYFSLQRENTYKTLSRGSTNTKIHPRTASHWKKVFSS